MARGRWMLRTYPALRSHRCLLQAVLSAQMLQLVQDADAKVEGCLREFAQAAQQLSPLASQLAQPPPSLHAVAMGSAPAKAAAAGGSG
jgi:acyl-CoA reductase-like NAD-dependent aldehyde dehydrogenase